jgi:hypothetical protein
LASKNETTNPTRTQDTITQLELIEERILAGRCLEMRAALDHKRARIAEKVKQGAGVEPGQFFPDRHVG